MEYLLQRDCCPIEACHVYCVYNDHTYKRSTLSSLRKGHLSVCKSLLHAKAEVNAKDKHGWTPLHLASRYVIIFKWLSIRIKLFSLCSAHIRNVLLRVYDIYKCAFVCVYL